MGIGPYTVVAFQHHRWELPIHDGISSSEHDIMLSSMADMPTSEEQNEGWDSAPEVCAARGFRGTLPQEIFEIRCLNGTISCKLRQKFQERKCQ